MSYDKQLAIQRSYFLKKIREFFEAEGFLEVDVPIMTPCVDPEVNLTPFETNLKFPNGDEKQVYLVPSPEFQIKKLLGSDFGNVYTITKVFRNGEIGGGRHNPEFTMLEWYRSDASYLNMMDDTEKFIKFLAGSLDESGLFDSVLKLHQAFDQPFHQPFERKSLNELFIEKVGIDLKENKSYDEFKKTAEDKGYKVDACVTWDDILYKIFLNDIEPDLGKERPIFVYDYPATQGALAKKKESDPFWVERFELYINGVELCNAFSELLDVNEQRKRFDDALYERKKLNKTVFPIDEEFLDSLKSIRHPYGGNALGLDRLLMVLSGKEKIDDVLLFPMEKMLGALHTDIE